MKSIKKIIIITLFIFCICSIGLTSFALDATYGENFANGYNTDTYIGLKDIRVMSMKYAIGGSPYIEQHTLSFYNSDAANVYQYPVLVYSASQRGLLEARPYRIDGYLAPYPWTETRVTFKDVNALQFTFTDFSLDLASSTDVAYKRVELIPYNNVTASELFRVTTYTVIDYTYDLDSDGNRINEQFREREFTETETYDIGNNRTQIITLTPYFTGVTTDISQIYVKECRTQIYGFTQDVNNDIDYQFYLHGMTADINYSGYEEFIQTIDYNPKEFNLVTSLFSDIQGALAVELFPHFSLGALLAVIVAVPLLLVILKFFFGG